jgi:hypothetical protein
LRTALPDCSALPRTHATANPPEGDSEPLPTGDHMIPTNWPYSQAAYEAFEAMKSAGYAHYCRGDRHAPHVLVSVYDWGHCGYIDVINIRGVDRATAARLPKYDGMDIFAPTQAVWHYMGALEHAVAALLRLPPPHHPDAPITAYSAPLTLFVSTREQRPMTIRIGCQKSVTCPDVDIHVRH